MNQELIKIDAFYAFHEIFEFCAFSEVQFLNLIQKQVEQHQTEKYMKNSRKLVDKSDFSIRSLNRYKTTVEKHISQIKMTLDVVRSRGDREWPRAIDHIYRERTEAAARQLEDDFEHLLSRAKNIGEKLDDCIYESLLENNKAQTATAETATAQTGYPTPMMALLCIALPIYITSFFSMNFKELQNLSVWIYFVVSTPLMLSLITVLVFWSKLSNLVPSPNRKEILTSMEQESEKTEERATPTRFQKSWLRRRRTRLPV